MHYLHAFLGYFSLFATVWFAMKLMHWRFTESLHNAMGTTMMFLSVLVTLSGSLSASVLRFYSGDKPWSAKEKSMMIGKIHRIFGYIVLLIGNFTITTGIFHYFEGTLQGDERSKLGAVSLLSFVLFIVVFEFIFRIRNKFALGHIETPTNVKVYSAA